MCIRKGENKQKQKKIYPSRLYRPVCRHRYSFEFSEPDIIVKKADFFEVKIEISVEKERSLLFDLSYLIQKRWGDLMRAILFAFCGSNQLRNSLRVNLFFENG